MDSHSQVNTWVVPTPGQQNMPTGLIDFANIPNFADMTNPDPYPLRNTGPAGSGLRTDTFSTSTEPFYSNLNYDFQGFRGQVLPSDPGTVPEGSIHESQLHGTASVASHYGDDQSPETQQARDMFGTLALGQQQQQQPAGQPVIKRSSSVASSSKVSKVSKLKCPGCNTVCKTNSELSKHNQRHAKSFLCGVNGCERKGGFGTLNDLNRHKKSVHNIGGGPIYACTENPCGRLAAGKPRKTFARADNFRSHLRKLHNMDLSTEDLAKYHYYPAPEERAQMEAESNLETLDEEASFIDGYIIEADDVLDDMTSERPEDDYVMSDFQSVPQMQPTEQQVISMEASASLTESGMLAQGTQFDQVFVNPSVFMPGEDINLNFGDQPNNDADNSDGVFAAGQWQAPEPLEESDSLSPDLSVPLPNASFGPLGTTGISDAEDTEDGTDRVAADESPSHLKSFDELVSDGVTTPAIVAFLRTVPRNLLEMALSGNVSISVTDSQSQPAKAGSRCPTCNKLFQRQCELKKHMKRHEKPYVCTFKGCVNRRFGSKNDWKRHESSQHDTAEQQRQSWVCRDPRCASKVHLFPSALAYREHLFATHKIRDEATIHAKLVEGVFGGRQDRYFWCGFCAKVMDGGSSSDSSSGPWNARCDHIDFHFSGKDMYAAAKFKDWKYLEDQAGMEEVLKASQGQQAMGPPPPTSSFASSLGGSFASVARSDTSEDTTSTLASNARKRKVAGPHTSRSRGSRRNGM